MAGRGASTSRRGIEQLLENIQGVVVGVGFLVGLLLAVRYWRGPPLAALGWMVATSGWQLSAFGAFATTSGLALASLSLVASLSNHPRAADVLDANPGRDFIRALITSTWLWLIPAVLALACSFIDSRILRALFIMAATTGASGGVFALLGVTIFFSRFTRRKPE